MKQGLNSLTMGLIIQALNGADVRFRRVERVSQDLTLLFGHTGQQERA